MVKDAYCGGELERINIDGAHHLVYILEENVKCWPYVLY